MNKKIYDIINNGDKYISSIAKEIVEAFEEKADQDNIDYNYTIDGETKQTKNKDANTYFWFDTMEDTNLHEFKKSLFDEDLKNIEEGSEEEDRLMQDVRDFLLEICKEITLKHKKRLRDVVRRVVLGDRYDETLVPLEEVEVISIDVADYSSIPESYKYLLRIGKEVGCEIDSDEVIKFIQDRQEKTGMDIDSIFSIEKQAGNPMFDGVMSIEQTRKYVNEISIYFYVDYSINVVESESEV